MDRKGRREGRGKRGRATSRNGDERIRVRKGKWEKKWGKRGRGGRGGGV